MCLTRRFLLAVLFGLTGALLAAGASAQTTRVTFILVNDIYLMGDQAMPDGKRRGGFARLATVVKAERARERAQGGHVIVAHAGDTLSPSMMSGIDKGEHIIALTNLIAPDIFVPGNHEFDFGKETFLQRMAEAKFPLYAANLRGADGAALPKFRDRSIVTFDGIRIGLTGAAFDETPRMSNSGDLQITPTVATLTEQAAALRREGADVVVAVTHADRRQDQQIIATRAVDLVLSGHDHDLFINYDGRTAAIESSYDAIYVTAIELTISVKVQDGRRTVQWWPRFRVIDTATVTPDRAIAAMVARYARELGREMDVPLGSTAVALDSRNATVRTGEAAIGNVLADAMRTAVRADVAIVNGGGIRGGKQYAPGATISRRDVLVELPFGNRLITIEVGGRTLRAAIEHGLSLVPDAAGRFPHVSGLAVEADASRPPGSRIISIMVGGAPLDDARRYRVATNDFLARGGDGYTMFRDAQPEVAESDAPTIANAVMVYIRQTGRLRTDVEGRVVVK